ncbi:MAG TPA: molybdopterin cofactor-binding domain-containing protein [Steroidobacteraceae bacterium]|nr:molybdopterin cofactor-binding domain-containing protein [Steroidobacteraceae bacterium]
MAAVFSRRTALRLSGALIVSFAIPLERGVGASQAAKKTVDPGSVESFLAINPDGTVTVFSGKVDLGTGLRTALTQMVADELDVGFSKVTLIQGDTDLTPDQGVTFGSLSIQNGGAQLRQAAATARRALLIEAGRRFKVPPESLRIEDGIVHPPQGEALPLAALLGKQGLSLKLDKTAPLKAPKDFKLVGKSQARLDIPDKITGQFTYMQDFVLPGMYHGRVIRPSALGATLLSIDEASIADIPGIVKVVRQENFLGIVAKTEWAAIRGSRRLTATWSEWSGLPSRAELWDHVRRTRIVKDDVTGNTGDSAKALGEAKQRLTATYDFAIHTHGSIGPSCAVAQFDGDHLTCWSASQATHNLRKQLAAMFSFKDEQVRCIYIDGSGCYGRNGHEDAAADAALLARAVNAPVRVQWMRADEHGWDPKGPPTLLDMRAGLDANGKITAWESELFIPNGAAGFVALVGADHAGLNSLGTLSPGGVIQDLAIPYVIDNVKTTAHRLESTPFKPAWIRSPGRMQNSFANESFFDEIAAHAKTDPLEARLRYLQDERGRELLERLATLSAWRTWTKSSHGAKHTGHGLAYTKYELVRTYVGVVCEVEVDRDSGQIAVKRFFVAHDCGQIINPDGLRNQIEGNVIQTVSRVLKEELLFSQSKVTSVDWASYPILRFPEVPEVVMDLIDRPDQVPWGAGEPTAAMVPGAIGNAVFDAIGVRLRSVPFTPAKVLAAIKKS